MNDTLYGRVIEILDGNSFYMEVLAQGRWNDDSYDDLEEVRLAGVYAPAGRNHDGASAEDYLRERLEGRVVLCDIRGRDAADRLVSAVSVCEERPVELPATLFTRAESGKKAARGSLS